MMFVPGHRISRESTTRVVGMRRSREDREDLWPKLSVKLHTVNIIPGEREENTAKLEVTRGGTLGRNEDSNFNEDLAWSEDREKKLKS